MSIALALLAAAVFGTGDFLGGLASRRTAMLTVLVLSQLVGLLGIALTAAVTGGSPRFGDLLAGAVGGVTGGFGVAMLYRGLAMGAMALVAPVTGVLATVVPVVAGAALGERPLPVQFAGMGLAVIAVAVLSGGSSPAGLRLRGQPLLLAVGAGLAFGLFYIALSRAASDAGFWPLVSARCTSVAMFALALAITRSRLRVPAEVRGLILGAGVLDVAANALYLLAVHRGLLSIVAVLVSLYPAATVICSLIVLGERLRPLQLAGIAAALVAVVLITI